MEKRCNFELFKSNVCHRLKESGDIDFLIETLEKDMIREYYNRKWYLECFYQMTFLTSLSTILCLKNSGIEFFTASSVIWSFFNTFAVTKEYKKMGGKAMPAELILIGGAAVIANYGFREMTTDIDAIIHAASVMKDAINSGYRQTSDNR